MNDLKNRIIFILVAATAITVVIMLNAIFIASSLTVVVKMLEEISLYPVGHYIQVISSWFN